MTAQIINLETILAARRALDAYATKVLATINLGHFGSAEDYIAALRFMRLPEASRAIRADFERTANALDAELAVRRRELIADDSKF